MPDRRVERTKQALRTALLELVAEHGYEEVGVQAIVDRANVGRATFYCHYADKEDLLLESLGALGGHIRSQIDLSDASESPSALRFALPMLQHVQAVRVMFAALEAVPALSQRFREVLGELITEYLPEGHPVPRQILVELTTAGFLSVARWWLLTAPGLEPYEVERRFVALMSPLLGARASAANVGPYSVWTIEAIAHPRA